MAFQHHLFALYAPEVMTTNAEECTIEDKALVYRISRIVRLKVGEQLMLFDDHVCRTLSLLSSEQNVITCAILKTEPIVCLKPEIHWLIPVLERDAMERIVYNLAACGVTSWYPIVAEKSHRNFIAPKELERLRRIAIAAAEQAKQFCLPTIHPVRAFNEIPVLMKKYTEASVLFFDPDGTSAHDVMTKLRSVKVANIVCMIGPEGDLVESEKRVLADAGFNACALVPTILRAEDACALATGMIRSLLK